MRWFRQNNSKKAIRLPFYHILLDRRAKSQQRNKSESISCNNLPILIQFFSNRTSTQIKLRLLDQEASYKLEYTPGVRIRILRRRREVEGSGIENISWDARSRYEGPNLKFECLKITGQLKPTKGNKLQYSFLKR